MKIYTKQGDAGQTGLYGGPRVPKDHLKIRSYGTLDELNAVLGVVLAEAASLKGKGADLQARLLRLQSELFQLGAELATPSGKNPGIALIEAQHIEKLENEIDAMEAELSPLKTFILPGGTALASQLHLARTVSRRGEREIISLHREESLRPEVLKYVNRLSDYLFVCARFANHLAGVEDVPWIAPKNR
jgi:cob(I)alamin adenosyltransferase